MKRQTTLTQKSGLVVLMLAALVLSGCGASKSVDDGLDLASRASGGDVSQNTQKAWSYCNDTFSQSQTFKTALYTYTENGSVRNDLMYMRPSALPSDFTSNTSYFQMYRWQANANSSTYLDPTPLSFKIVNPNNGTILLANKTSLRWSDVSTTASSWGISDPKEFFRRVWVIVDLRDPTAQFDVMMTVLYNTSDNKERDRSNSLLPIFDADPTGYATEPSGAARPQVLRNLHPFRDRINQGWTTAEFKSQALTLCTPFNN